MYHVKRALCPNAISVAILALASCASVNAAGPPAAPEAVVFAATGDGPRGDEDWTLLPEYFAAERADGRAQFMVHTGDLCKGSTVFDSEYSARVAELYRQSPIPIFFVVGDNEWNDQPDPWAARPIWERDFMRFHKQYPGAPEVRRQEGHLENFAWLDRGVILIGINLVGGRMHDVEEWGARHRANADWVEQNLANFGDESYATVVIAQAHPKPVHEDFFRRFVPAVAAYGKPVLYLHGDGHRWQFEEGWRAPNLVRIQVDQVTKARPAHIIVSPDNPARPFSYDRHGAGSEG